MESGIQKVGIQNPDAGIRNLEAGIRNPGPSWILLHGAIRTTQTLDVCNLLSVYCSSCGMFCKWGDHRLYANMAAAD